MKGYIVVWQGRPMRDAAPSTLLKKERGRLFTGGFVATVFPTYEAARRALLRSVRAWAADDGTTKVTIRATIGNSSQWNVVRLVPARKEQPRVWYHGFSRRVYKKGDE